MTTFLIKKYFLVLVFITTGIMTLAQCEGLKGDKEGMNEWRKKYFEYFSTDSTTTRLIKADSVLIFYLSNGENETNYGMPCCYYLAEKYAQVELKRNLKLLYKKLEKQDSIKF